MKESDTKLFNVLNTRIAQSVPSNDSLLSGKLGLAWYYFTLYCHTEDPTHAEDALAQLESVILSYNTAKTNLRGNAFSCGGAGLGYLVTTFEKAGLIAVDLEPELRALDSFLFESSIGQIQEYGDIDFLHGAFGVLHYFNTRADEIVIRKYIIELVEALEARIVRQTFGSWLSNDLKGAEPEINFSLSHGLSGQLLILLKTFQAGIQQELIKKLVYEGIQLVQNFSRPPNEELGEYQQFPVKIVPGVKPQPIFNNRLAWCYGDLNIVILLSKAGKIFHESNWQAQSYNLGFSTIQRKDGKSTQVSDCHFCHGAAGLAQVYSSLYLDSGLAFYQEASEYWISSVLHRLPAELNNGIYNGKEGSLLEGLPGIALALITYLYPNPGSRQDLLLF